MTKKIFRSIFVVAMAILLSCLAFIIGVLYNHFDSVQKKQLKSEMILAAKAVEMGGLDYLESFDAQNCRITWVGADGTVLYDSEYDAALMENHAQRAEIQKALQSGEAEYLRYSETLTKEILYYAMVLKDGTVLRISVSQAPLPILMLGLFQPILVVCVLALILSAVLAGNLSKKIVEPLNSLDLDSPLENDVYEELSPLLTHIDQQHKKIKRQKEELKYKQKEFYTVIKNMQEGLVLLSKNGTILSVNPAAAAFFDVGTDCIGEDFLTIERSMEVNKVIQTALTQGHGEVQMSRNGREYQVNVSRIRNHEEISGIVILVFDNTEKFFAERNRKEFTANVSHELKTPLHTIMGSAELLESGMVKQEDVQVFVGRIRKEAARLLSLIEDIIRLSQLDEHHKLPSERLELYQLVKTEADALTGLAEAKQVQVIVEGEPVWINAVHKLFHEILYNLLENAIKYNVSGGKVWVRLSSNEKEVVLSVKDTGIGIPAEHQARVFERFYRVDKSHSKETGGTGLGLSIVKHAVQDMGGVIHLQSRPMEGTCITISFALQGIDKNFSQ